MKRKSDPKEPDLPIRGEIALRRPVTPGLGLAGCVVFPGPYALAMGNLGFQYIHYLLSRAGWEADRSFIDVPKRPSAIPAGIFSGIKLSSFDLLAFTLPWELDLPRVLRILELAGLEPDRARRRGLPLIIAGGAAVSANPYPVSRVFDLIFPGEAECGFERLLERIAENPPPSGRGAGIRGWKSELTTGMERDGLAFAGGIERGAYGGFVGRMSANAPELDDLEVCSGWLTPDSVFPMMHLIEYNRGCTHACRFCLTGHLVKNIRFRSHESTMRLASLAEGRTDRVGLVGSALSDNPDLPRTLTELKERGFSVGMSSLKVASTTPELVALCQEAGAESLTFGVESGSMELQRKIGKRIDFDKLSALIGEAFGRGMRSVRLYMLAGVPGETEQQVLESVDFVKRLAQKHLKSSRGTITVSVAPLARKCLTPWQDVKPLPSTVIKRHMNLYKKGLKGLPRLKLTLDSLRERNVQEYMTVAGEEAFDVLLRVSREDCSLGAWIAAIREAQS